MYSITNTHRFVPVSHLGCGSEVLRILVGGRVSLMEALLLLLAASCEVVETFLGTGSPISVFTGLSGEIWRLPSGSVSLQNSSVH